jgi:hypothetical protein
MFSGLVGLNITPPATITAANAAIISGVSANNGFACTFGTFIFNETMTATITTAITRIVFDFRFLAFIHLLRQ